MSRDEPLPVWAPPEFADRAETLLNAAVRVSALVEMMGQQRWTEALSDDLEKASKEVNRAVARFSITMAAAIYEPRVLAGREDESEGRE